MGLKAVPNLSGRVLAYAYEQKLSAEDFDGVQPTGRGGNYTNADIDAIVAQKAAPRD